MGVVCSLGGCGLLSRSVGIGLVGFHGTECVIDKSMVSLVRSDDENNVTHHGIFLFAEGERRDGKREREREKRREERERRGEGKKMRKRREGKKEREE